MNGGDMSVPIKDPAIKLFGAKIPVPDTRIPVRYYYYVFICMFMFMFM